MATVRTFLFPALAFLLGAAVLSGCISLGGSSGPLVTTSHEFSILEGQSESFRLDRNGSTPQYSLRAENVMNKTALFIFTPGDIRVALAEGAQAAVDLDSDGNPDVVLALANAADNVAEVTVYVAGAAAVCTNDCAGGERQRAYPDCSCFVPLVNCSGSCAAGQVQRPYPDCSCYAENRTCSDGTLYDQCSASPPSKCVNGSLVNACAACGCPTGRSCNSSSNACYTPAAGPTPTPRPGATPSPVPTASPTPDAGGAAIAVANQTTEGLLLARFDAAYKNAALCTQSEFTSAFTTRKNRAPTGTEISLFASTKSYLPTGVSVSASVNGTAWTVRYRNSGAHATDALTVTVQGGVASGPQWVDGGPTTTQRITDLNNAAAISGNCGLILIMNGW